MSSFLDYYYYATAGGAKIWWKKYLTSMQITQFIIDIVIIYYAGSLDNSLSSRNRFSHFSCLQRTTNSSPRLALAPTPQLCLEQPSSPPTSTSSSTSICARTSLGHPRRLQRRPRLSELDLISIRGTNAALSPSSLALGAATPRCPTIARRYSSRRNFHTTSIPSSSSHTHTQHQTFHLHHDYSDCRSIIRSVSCCCY